MKNPRPTIITLGKPLFCFDSCPSTNDIAKKLAKFNFPEGTSVQSDMQTAGRGRLGRQWISPDGENIFVSVLLRPPTGPDGVLLLSIIGALGVAKTLGSYTNKKIEIKWPNDVLVCGRKISGILSELKIKGNFIDHVIMGIGINLNTKLNSLPKDLISKTTSLLLQTGKNADRGRFLKSLFKNLSYFYNVFLDGSAKEIIASAEIMLFRYNREVIFKPNGRSKRAIIKGIAADGSLKLQINQKISKFYSGEIILK